MSFVLGGPAFAPAGPAFARLVTEACRLLGITRNTLVKRMQRYGL